MTAHSNRPISPHLSIYKPQISTVLSITHRITGLGLAAGALLLAFWLYAAAYDAQAFQCLHRCMSEWYGQLFLIGWTAAFFYHLSNGIRHLWWDAGQGFGLKEMALTGWTVILFTLAMTAATWWLVYNP